MKSRSQATLKLVGFRVKSHGGVFRGEEGKRILYVWALGGAHNQFANAGCVLLPSLFAYTQTAHSLRTRRLLFPPIFFDAIPILLRSFMRIRKSKRRTKQRKKKEMRTKRKKSQANSLKAIDTKIIRERKTKHRTKIPGSHYYHQLAKREWLQPICL